MTQVKKLIFFICLMSINLISFAETCPNIAAIKHQTLKGWVAYDSEEGTVLSSKRAAQFNRLVEKFVLAEWKMNPVNKDGAIHCYYLDKTGSNLEAYLAKDHFEPVKNNKNYWYQVSGFTQCAAGKSKCAFRKSISADPQLARK